MYETTYFVRPTGPVCTEAPLFLERDVTRRNVYALLNGELKWYWTSELSGDRASGGTPATPSPRPLTALTDATVDALLADLSETDVDGNRRSLTLFGLQQELVDEGSALELRAALTEFMAHECGPLAVIINQICDSPWAHIFATHQRTVAARAVLTSIGGDESLASRVRPYSQLYTARLETLADYLIPSGG